MMNVDGSALFSPKINVSSHTFGIDFNPVAERLQFVTCHVSSEVFLWCQEESSDIFKTHLALKPHHNSCRTAKFFPNGKCFVTGSADKTCVVTNLDGAVVWASYPDSPHTDAVNVVFPLNNNLFLSGDDVGRVVLWDIRCASSCFSLSVDQDVIFAIHVDSMFHCDQFLVTCGDRLGNVSMRYPKIRLKSLSDAQEADLLCCTSARNGSKILCGTTGNGAISIFDWNNLADCNDRILNHGVSVDYILPIKSTPEGDDILVTGSGDGMIRILSLFPHDVLGCIGPHNSAEDPIEVLALTPDKHFVVSGGHDNILVFHSLPTEAHLKQILAMNPSERVLTKVLIRQDGDFFSDL